MKGKKAIKTLSPAKIATEVANQVENNLVTPKEEGAVAAT